MNSDKNLVQDYEILIKNNNPIEAKNPDYEKIFKDLQGGIIKSYGRKYYLYLFISFDPNKKEAVKHWIRDEIAKSVTSTSKQLEDTEIFKKTIKEMKKQGLDSSTYSGSLCKNFFLSYQGYQALGVDNKWGTEPNLFKRGMKNWWKVNYCISPPPAEYWYNPPESWDVGGDKPIHALIFLAHDDLAELKSEATALIDECQRFGEVLACEAGYVLKNISDNENSNKGRSTIGPFGFADNISQPLFLKNDYENYCTEQGIEQWNPKASLRLVLVKDPFGKPWSFGSYCVWQKLETNYERFEKKVNELAQKLAPDHPDLERASALVIGRFKDGTPLDLYRDEKDERLTRNDFNYENDKEGAKCPLHAHIRKLNPRKDDPTREKDRRTNSRIFRAGITYFDDPKVQQISGSNISQLCLNKLDYLNELSEKSLEDNIKSISGLLFVCFQSSILNQFSKLQQEWADDREFPRKNEGDKYLDPVIGHPAAKGHQNSPAPQEWPKEWNDSQSNFSPYSFNGCVRNRGGEFFFAPSISFLKKLP